LKTFLGWKCDSNIRKPALKVQNPEFKSHSHPQKRKLFFPLRSGIRQGCSFSPLQSDIVVKTLVIAVTLENEIKASSLERKN
jgi:hypothetical protein